MTFRLSSLKGWPMKYLSVLDEPPTFANEHDLQFDNEKRWYNKALSAADLEVEVDEKEIVKLMKELLLTPKKFDKKPTIAELEKILNSDGDSSVGILPDGEVAMLRPKITIESVAKAIAQAMPGLLRKVK